MGGGEGPARAVLGAMGVAENGSKSERAKNVNSMERAVVEGVGSVRASFEVLNPVPSIPSTSIFEIEVL